ncbi:MAG TPA: ATP-binding protein [Gaiellaceae bacterium]|nr:ATP-binding protein [Gaiellaceae bacterium]
MRLTLPFAVAMAVVLAATGAFVYIRVGHQLIRTVDTNLRAQLVEVKTNASEQHELIDKDATLGPTVAAIELPSGEALARDPASLAEIPVRVSGAGTALFTTRIPGLHGDWRVAQTRGRLAGRDVVLVAARSLEARDETLDHLARGFMFAAPAALLLAVLAGYALAAAALRPVEAMRRRAEAVSAHETGQRLPVPPARDELRALAVTLNDMLARLEAAFEHERRFVGDASHELRTPLALLRAELELALSRPRSRDELEQAVRSAMEETERLSRLAEDLLLIARSEHGQLPVRLEPVRPGELLERVRTRFAVRAETLGRPLRVGECTTSVVSADPLRLEQALGNLVDNALTHGGGAVTLLERVHDGVVELHVTDEGAGFPTEFTERAFDRFSRADGARGGGGSGLGLAIVASIARAHGGAAQLRNTGDRGSDVWISVPRIS